MAPSRKKGRRATAAAAALNQWKIGDLVLAKLKGFPAWPAEVSEPEKWGYSSDRKKLLVYFYGTKQIAFCNYADIEAFTEEKKKSLLVKRQGRGADFVRAVEEIVAAYEKKFKSNLITSDDEGNNSHSGQLEGSRSKSSRNSPEINLESDNNNQSSYKIASDNHNMIGISGVPKTSAEVDYPQSTNTSNEEPIENVQTLSTPRTTKKRTRNGSLQSHVIHKLPSRRRSKSSSGVQKSSVAEDFTHEAVCEFNSNVSQESSLKKLSSCNGVPSSDCSVENMSDTAAFISDAEKINKLSSNCELNISNELASVNAKTDHLDNNKASIEKKKRNSNRKQTTNDLDRVTVEKDTELDTKSHTSPCKSPSCSKEVAENFIKADGDEHLPLVKRARVRMGKQSLEEKPLAEDTESRDNAVVVSPMEESSSCPNKDKDAATSSPVADCSHINEEDSVIWKVNKFQSEGLSADIEAALPPSKRLHRALEAMSANAAESTNTTDDIKDDKRSDFPKKDPLIITNNETNCDTHLHSSKENLQNISGNGSVQSPNGSVCIHSSDVASGLSSQGEPANAQRLRSPHIKEKCIDSCTNIVLSSDSREPNLQPCSSKPVKELFVATANELVSHQLSPEDTTEKKKAALQSSIRCSNSQSETIVGKSDYVTNTENSKFLPATKPTVVNISSATSNTSGSAKSPSSQSEENPQARDMLNEKDDAYTITQRDWSSYDSTPMKDLIAAAQKRRLLSRSTTFPYTGSDGKEFGDSVVSPLGGYNKSDSSGQGSPGNYRLHHRPATDDRANNLQNVVRQSNGVNKPTSGVEARKSFEALLNTLSRTKDSIGRATRMAIDCAKYAIAGEVIESLLQHLEKEPSMHKRVDLFFLVDSIIQFSRNQKGGGTGDVYPSIVLPALPRLLSAAAPHGNSAWENRRQCLKVLRLWLDRKTFPESTIRHYIRELESKNEASLPTYSRRQARTERSVDDPIREMEGMLVDEYGSNTSFHLQNFIHPPLREDAEESSDDEKSFEAVTPEYTNTEAENDEKTTSTRTPNNAKVHHILAEVDGELEMEDVAPPCVVEHNETSGTIPPPLPQVLPPSPPPLPSSPPPVPPLAPQCQFVSPPNNYTNNMTTSEPMNYYRHAYGGLSKHMPPPPPPPVYSGNNFQHKTSPSLPHKPYHLQPPPPSVSNQFSYIQADTRPRSWDTNSYGDRFEYAKNRPGAYYGDRNTRRPNRHDSYDEGERYSPAINKGSSYSDKPDPLRRYSPYSERTSSSSHGWSNTPRISDYSAHEHPTSRVNRGRGYWQPR